jgi:hypothetical protein
MPVIGYLSSLSGDYPQLVDAFRQGLKESGCVEGQNVAIEFRFAEGHYDRLSALAADLVRRKVNVLVATGGTSTVVAAKPLVPATIPMVFAMGGDPVKLGIVDSIARPSGHATGVYFLVNGLAPKRVQFLHEMVPTAAVIGFLVNPSDPNTVSDTKDVQAAADTLGLKLVVHLGTGGRHHPGTMGGFTRNRHPDLVLAVALEFERVGLSVVPHGHTKPALDPETLWRIPPNINVTPIPPPIRKIRARDIVILHNRRSGNRGKANIRKKAAVS